MRSRIIMIAVTALIVVGCLAVVAFAAYNAGYTVGSVEAEREKYSTLTGVYIAEDPEYGTLALVLNEDGTCYHPFGLRGEWKLDGYSITFEFDSITQKAQFDSQTFTIIYEDRRYEKIS